MNLKHALRTAVAVAALFLVAQPAFAEEPMVTVSTVDPPPVAKIFVTLDATSDLVIERMRGSNWDVVCTGTCGELLPLDGYYRVSGPGIRDSKPFRLEGAPGERLTITADTGSTGVYDAGIVFTLTGGLALATAGWIVYYELLDSIDDHYGGAAKGMAFGLELGAVGAAVTTIGIVLIAGNPPSTVRQSASGRTAKVETRAPAPTWHTREFRG
ncbi:MAG: hypothetical protein ABIP89_22415, partial [Polyangiaceae bacterium]